MKKIMKYVRRVLILIFALMVVFLINGFFEYIIVQNRIDDFKSRGIFEKFSETENINYYRVPKEYEYEDTSRNIYNFDKKWIGSKSDIIITNRNPMREVPSLALTVGFLASNFYVGHATINSTDDGSRIYEVIGNSSDDNYNVVIDSYNNWITSDAGDTPIIIGLRIKNTTPEQRDKIIEYVALKEGMPYNFTFLFNRKNSFYCTDLVSRAIHSAGINVNYDYLATTGNDMIVSKNVYITFYRELIVENGVQKYNIYYLD